ncbi:MAG TPA: nuclear transport factor 2 family protein [Gaiella sp.]|jgi:ketosteroid isomerase-like protein
MPGNAAIVRRGYEALSKGDLTKVIELFGDDVSWHTPGRSPLAGDVVGRQAVFARLGRYVAETGGTFRADLKRVLTDEDGRVIGIHHNVAERQGRRLDTYGCIVFELENGRIVDGREHVYDLQAWDEFWS